MDLNMMSEYLLGDEGYEGGPSGSTGCGCVVFLAFVGGALFVCKLGWGVFAMLFG